METDATSDFVCPILWSYFKLKYLKVEIMQGILCVCPIRSEVCRLNVLVIFVLLRCTVEKIAHNFWVHLKEDNLKLNVAAFLCLHFSKRHTHTHTSSSYCIKTVESFGIQKSIMLTASVKVHDVEPAGCRISFAICEICCPPFSK